MSNGLKTTTYEIPKGRDKGKKFLITEMPAMQADEWAHRLVYQASMSGIDLKNVDILNIDTKSMTGMIEIGAAILSVLGKIPPADSREMKFELLDRCVQIIPTGGQPRSCMWEQEILDFQNFMVLAAQALKVHVGFLVQGET